MNKNIEQISFAMIADSGDAKTMMLAALADARQGKFDEADRAMKDAEKLILKAHLMQTELIKSAAEGQPQEFSILLTHSQDHLMNALLAKTLIAEMILMYKELKKKH
jgi:PTS system cellobiose-specific IIA component